MCRLVRTSDFLLPVTRAISRGGGSSKDIITEPTEQKARNVFVSVTKGSLEVGSMRHENSEALRIDQSCVLSKPTLRQDIWLN